MNNEKFQTNLGVKHVAETMITFGGEEIGLPDEIKEILRTPRKPPYLFILGGKMFKCEHKNGKIFVYEVDDEGGQHD